MRNNKRVERTFRYLLQLKRLFTSRGESEKKKKDFHQAHSGSLICIKGHRRLTHKAPEKCPQVELIENVTRFDLMDQFGPAGPYRTRLPLFSHFPISSFICDRQMERKKRRKRELMVFWFINDIWTKVLEFFCYLILILHFFCVVMFVNRVCSSFGMSTTTLMTTTTVGVDRSNNARTFFISTSSDESAGFLRLLIHPASHFQWQCFVDLTMDGEVLCLSVSASLLRLH